MFAGAGLPQLPALAAESKTDAEQMFQFPQIGALADEDARQAIAKPTLAAFGPGAHRPGQVAAHIGATLSALAPARDKLIHKGMIYAPRYGEVAFTVPLFDAFMKRVMSHEA